MLSLLLFRCRYRRSAGIFCRTICPTSYEHLQHRLLKFWPELLKRWLALSSGLVLRKVIVLSNGQRFIRWVVLSLVLSSLWTTEAWLRIGTNFSVNSNSIRNKINRVHFKCSNLTSETYWSRLVVNNIYYERYLNFTRTEKNITWSYGQHNQVWVFWHSEYVWTILKDGFVCWKAVRCSYPPNVCIWTLWIFSYFKTSYLLTFKRHCYSSKPFPGSWRYLRGNCEVFDVNRN